MLNPSAEPQFDQHVLGWAQVRPRIVESRLLNDEVRGCVTVGFAPATRSTTDNEGGADVTVATSDAPRVAERPVELDVGFNTRPVVLIAAAAGLGTVLSVLVAVVGAVEGWSPALWATQLGATVMLATGASAAAARVAARRRTVLADAEAVVWDLEVTTGRVERIRQQFASERSFSELVEQPGTTSRLERLVIEVADQVEDVWFARSTLIDSGNTDLARRLAVTLGKLGIGRDDLLVLAAKAVTDEWPWSDQSLTSNAEGDEIRSSRLAWLLFAEEFSRLPHQGAPESRRSTFEYRGSMGLPPRETEQEEPQSASERWGAVLRETEQEEPQPASKRLAAVFRSLGLPRGKVIAHRHTEKLTKARHIMATRGRRAQRRPKRDPVLVAAAMAASAAALAPVITGLFGLATHSDGKQASPDLTSCPLS